MHSSSFSVVRLRLTGRAGLSAGKCAEQSAGDFVRPVRFLLKMKIKLALVALTAGLLGSAASAQVVFSNNFETDTAGFTAGGSLSSLSRVTLPTDSGGPASLNTSTWLGKIGDGVAKGGLDEIVQLNLAGLVAGSTYFVNFDLLIGASWDGAANGYGPDSWRLTANGTTLVDTIFANGAQGINFGAYSPQRYTDQNYTNPNGPDVPRFTGADQFWSADQGGNYANDYSIYYFGHGAGNPVLSFVASSSTAILQFSRYGSSSDSPDEYWGLDNVSVVGQSAPTSPSLTAVPEPSTYALAGVIALGGIVALKRRKAKVAARAV
jgi:hypothetical protein